MMCEACERGDHEECGMQTWCECDCDGPGGIYLPDDHYFVDDLDGGRLLKKATEETKEGKDEMSDRIGDDPGVPNHGEAADYFNRLLLDLKKQLLRHEHDPITMERLNDGTKHVLELDGCRRPLRRY